ncbi:MAG: hypothetical protein LBB20_02645 [Puniceicoccales bacterium]|jgi:hypothetical protein|nr:hypothetical protein [Puniceicoccales bacterium]
MSDFRRSKKSDANRIGFIEGDFGCDGTVTNPDPSDNSDKCCRNSLKRGRASRSAIKKCDPQGSAIDFVVNDTSRVMSDAISMKHSGKQRGQKRPVSIKKSTTVHEDIKTQSQPSCTDLVGVTEEPCPDSDSNRGSKFGRNGTQKKYSRIDNKRTRNDDTGKKYACTKKKCACSSFISKIMSFFGFSSKAKESSNKQSNFSVEKPKDRPKSYGVANANKKSRTNSDLKTKEKS